MKKITQEFKEFISRGNVMDLAVGMIIGSAFTAIVTSLVNDIIMPLISALIGGMDFSSWNVVIGSGEDPATLAFGSFIAAVIDFILIALVIFMLIKTINNLRKKMEKKTKEEATASVPATKMCPYCQTEISVKATRCPHCTSQLEKTE